MSTVTAVPLRPIRRRVLVYFWVGLLLAVVAAVALAWKGDPGISVAPGGLRYQILKPAAGPHPGDDDVALINYEGRLLNGQVFDRSQQPTPMPLKGVVPGFAQALKLMPKGAKYRFWLPPSLAYGDKANGPIPANSTLQFDIELLEFIPEAAYRQMMMQQMMQQGGGAMPPGAGAPPEGAPGGR